MSKNMLGNLTTLGISLFVTWASFITYHVIQVRSDLDAITKYLIPNKKVTMIFKPEEVTR